MKTLLIYAMVSSIIGYASYAKKLSDLQGKAWLSHKPSDYDAVKKFKETGPIQCTIIGIIVGAIVTAMLVASVW